MKASAWCWSSASGCCRPRPLTACCRWRMPRPRKAAGPWMTMACACVTRLPRPTAITASPLPRRCRTAMASRWASHARSASTVASCHHRPRLPRRAACCRRVTAVACRWCRSMWPISMSSSCACGLRPCRPSCASTSALVHVVAGSWIRATTATSRWPIWPTRCLSPALRWRPGPTSARFPTCRSARSASCASPACTLPCSSAAAAMPRNGKPRFSA